MEAEGTITIPKSCKVTNTYGLVIKIDSLFDLLKIRELNPTGEKVDVRVNIEGVIKDFTFEEFMVRLGFTASGWQIKSLIERQQHDVWTRH